MKSSQFLGTFPFVPWSRFHWLIYLETNVLYKTDRYWPLKFLGHTFGKASVLKSKYCFLIFEPTRHLQIGMFVVKNSSPERKIWKVGR